MEKFLKEGGISFQQNNKVEIKGAKKGFAQAFSGLKGFKFELDVHDGAWMKKRTGRYLRDLGVYAKSMAYDAETGKGKIDLHLNFSNKADTFFNLSSKWKMNTKANLCMVQLNGASRIEQKYVTGQAQSRRRGDKKFLRLYLD